MVFKENEPKLTCIYNKVQTIYPEDEDQCLKDAIGIDGFSFYILFLYGTIHKDLIEFIETYYSWLDNLSGKDCLITLFENPQYFGRRWKEYWLKQHGADFKNKFAKYCEIVPEDRDFAYVLAENLNIPKKSLPCMVFLSKTDFEKRTYFPIIVNKENYEKYFEDIFTALQKVSEDDIPDNIAALQHVWSKLWVRWRLGEWIKKRYKSIQMLVLILIELKNSILNH